MEDSTHLIPVDIAPEAWSKAFGIAGSEWNQIQSPLPALFLTLIDDMVTAVHYFDRYQSWLSIPRKPNLHQRDFALVGELVLDQMAIWRGPAIAGNRVAGWMTATKLAPPTTEEIAKAAGGLVPTMIAPTADRTAQGIPKIIRVPKAWTSYSSPIVPRLKPWSTRSPPNWPPLPSGPAGMVE